MLHEDIRVLDCIHLNEEARVFSRYPSCRRHTTRSRPILLVPSAITMLLLDPWQERSSLLQSAVSPVNASVFRIKINLMSPGIRQYKILVDRILLLLF